MSQRLLDTSYFRCGRCGALASATDSAGYESDYYFHSAAAENGQRRRGALQWRWVQRLAREYPHGIDLAPRRTAVEFGCSRGYFVETCLGHGLDIRGFDVSEVAIASARARGLGASCVRRDLSDHSDDAEIEPVSLVFAWELLEHFDDPAVLLNTARRTLRLGGWLIGSTPNGQSSWIRLLGSSWHGFGIPQYHRTYLNPTALRQVFERNKFGDIVTLTCVDWRDAHLLKHTATELTKKAFGTSHIGMRAAVALTVGPFEKAAELASGRVGGLNGDTLLFAARRIA
jgi:2-polyprenyl-3-methyl-5-hydroxy-6-metoxy-1,4-benzoquinol methylase